MALTPFLKSSDTSLEALRRKLLAEMRVVTRIDDDGHAHMMVWIPRMSIPANTIGAWPVVAFQCGGFFVDQYQCHNIEEMIPGPAAKAVSQPGFMPWRGSRTDAIALAAARTFYGVSCELPTLKEWTALAIIPRLLGHAIHGNNSNGSDERVGVVEGVMPESSDGPIWAGSGPNTYSLTGGPNAPFDLVGNVDEWLADDAPAGRVAIQKGALVNDAGGISAEDEQVTINGIEDPTSWPATNGVVQINDELIRYATYTRDIPEGTAVLGGLTRALRGTAAAIHGDAATVTLFKEYCVIPGGSSLFVVSGLDNTDSPVTFQVNEVLHGPGRSAISIGDKIVAKTQLITVTAISGGSVTGTRSAPASVPDLTPAIVLAASGLTTTGGTTQSGFQTAFRTDDVDVAPALLPASCATDWVSDEASHDGFRVFAAGATLPTALARGGHYISPDNSARHGFTLSLKRDTDDTHTGLRCVQRFAP